MKRNLLLFLLVGIAGVQAQVTHHVMWGLGEPAASFSLTINQGDTVEWMWSSPHPHTVTSMNGSVETFDSGTITGVGNMWSHTFTEAGTNPYHCNFHSGMQGIITVQQVMNVERPVRASFAVHPNPVATVLTINADAAIDEITVYDISGRVLAKTGNALNTEAKIYTEGWPAGSYFVKISAGGSEKTVPVVKK